MRGKGEGSIYQRESDGQWVGSITLENGKRRTFYGKKREDVSTKMKVALADQLKGILPAGRDQTMGDFLARWLSDVVKHRVRESTFASYEEMVRLHALPTIGKVTLQKLTGQQLASLYAIKLAAGLSPRTVQYLAAILHSALRQALRWDLVARNVADLVDAPRAKSPAISPLMPDQLQKLVETARGDSLEALFVLAATTGLRQGELLGLRWRDIDLPTGSLHVTQQARRLKGQGITFTQPKTDAGRRTVALPIVAVEALRRHRVAQLEARLLAGSEWTDLDLIFANAVGKPCDRGNVVRRHFEPLLERAGLPRVNFHSLRHGHASLLLAQGAHPKQAQERLGHASIALTMNTYSHLLPDSQADVVRKLDTFFGAG